MTTQLVVGEGGLDQALTVVEGAVYPQGHHVATQCRELRFLSWADSAQGVEHCDANALEPLEGAGDGASRVSGRGDQDRSARTAPGGERRNHASHEPSSDVLEGQSGSMKQLQEVPVALSETYEGDREIDCVPHHRFDEGTVQPGAEEMDCRHRGGLR